MLKQLQHMRQHRWCWIDMPLSGKQLAVIGSTRSIRHILGDPDASASQVTLQPCVFPVQLETHMP
jgi:hypothetical protein